MIIGLISLICTIIGFGILLTNKSYYNMHLETIGCLIAMFGTLGLFLFIIVNIDIITGIIIKYFRL